MKLSKLIQRIFFCNCGLPTDFRLRAFREFIPWKSAFSTIWRRSVIRSGMKAAAAEGAGLGLGGIATMVPDLSILAGITLRTIQKLSLLYGFEFNTDEEAAELWIAAASAAGVDISRELLEKEVVNRFVPTGHPAHRGEGQHAKSSRSGLDG